ncbi:hypothetical protein CDL15_Pgr009560 [Punica granatum]|uniref:Uncharacterized protein n=1 Tax=Punica granatum TaxID=22663 RepID=A0A218WTI4_PUNGR|nr:hypothetical protein CDL15_Pgr009560 [Punica granatum]PKI36791.1 hypothetical protein CRG98_042740 [Punica granatum]
MESNGSSNMEQQKCEHVSGGTVRDGSLTDHVVFYGLGFRMGWALEVFERGRAGRKPTGLQIRSDLDAVRISKNFRSGNIRVLGGASAWPNINHLQVVGVDQCKELADLPNSKLIGL